MDDRGLFVQESGALGGFGFNIGGSLVNLDTLKYYEALIAMDRAGFLEELSLSGRRAMVWEIGGGWGGFAYHFKVWRPDTTYVIIDLPELFLFSATYLRSVFPAARIRMYGDVPDRDLFADWESQDFIFLPNTFLAGFEPPRVDLTLNMVSFQEMTKGQVEGYLEKSAELGTPRLYSLNRSRPKYNRELEDLNPLLARHYDLTLIDVLPVDYTTLDMSTTARAVTLPPGVGWAGMRAEFYAPKYLHVCGRLRTSAGPTRVRDAAEASFG
ncbi:MAG: putative sugar O-methyltransferase [Elusimicrobia bacterium]|nr:putative sugar O-methyltransferase [Elusimicrobiota bacterium]